MTCEVCLGGMVYLAAWIKSVSLSAFIYTHFLVIGQISGGQIDGRKSDT